MENKDYIKYIDSSIRSKFDNIKLDECNYEGQPNNNFYSQYRYKGYSLAFVKDRSFLEVEISKNDNYTMLHEINESFLDVKISKRNIDSIIEYLHENDGQLFQSFQC